MMTKGEIVVEVTRLDWSLGYVLEISGRKSKAELVETLAIVKGDTAKLLDKMVKPTPKESKSEETPDGQITVEEAIQKNREPESSA